MLTVGSMQATRDLYATSRTPVAAVTTPQDSSDSKPASAPASKQEPSQPSFRELRSRIDRAMLRDRFRLKNSLRAVERAAKSKQPFDRNLQKLIAALDRSCELRDKRAFAAPTVRLNKELPIANHREMIEDAIRANQVIILCGETGSGKSTQLPLICLGMGRGVDGLIGHTQPRRIAARSVAARVAEELGTGLGQAVGFKVRFTDQTQPTTLVKLMTDGILLAESQGDPYFEQYDTLIIDEAHERSLNIDFLLGRMKQLLPKRPDLKLIITSATIDAARFAEHFGTPEKPVPVIEVEGRTYPVEIRYRPPIDEDAGDGQSDSKQNSSPRTGENSGPGRRRQEADIQTAILDAVDEVGRIDNGDILIFMPTERDIHETAKSLRGRLLSDRNKGRITEILPLYARLSAKDQNRIFKMGPHRRIVIATNVAESSLTVPGIRFVIDTGTARISRYSARSRMQRLPVEPISQASANQRSGRCGRVGPGVAIRLYSETDFNSRDAYTAPEIQRTNLAAVILQTAALKLGSLEDFPFLEPPRTGTITDGYRTLFELGALDEQNRLTEIGRQLSRLPVDPRVGRIILAAHDENCLNEILVIAAALELQDPRDRPIDQQQAADEAHKKFQHEQSDFLSYLKLWDFIHDLLRKLSRSQFRKACQQNFLSYNRVREWIDVHQQIAQLVAEAGLKPAKRRDDFDAIHRALLVGFLANIALLGDKHEYTAAGNQKVTLWPGSGLFAAKPKWIVAAELVETTKRYVRCVARIKPEWLEPLGGHLIKRSHTDPEWDGRQGSAMVFEKATLFGLPIIERRRVRYSQINEKVSREMMIQHGFVEGDVEMELPFLTHNRRLIEELEGLQTRTRRYDLICDDDVRYDFYDKHIPADVTDVQAVKRWLNRREQNRRRRKKSSMAPRPVDAHQQSDSPPGLERKSVLHMTREDVRRTGTEEVTGHDFPDQVQVERMQLPLEYHLEPGSPEDGVTIAVPQEALNQLSQSRLGWLVPGLLEEKVVALIKSLPKSMRRQFVPAADTARDVLKRLKFGDGEFDVAVAKLLSQIGREHVTPEDFQAERLPNHLRMNVRVIDSEGDTITAGRDLDSLRKKLGSEVAASFAKISDDVWNRDGVTSWDFGDLLAQVTIKRGGVTMIGYPSLIDAGESVNLRLIDLPSRSALETRAGLRRLASIALSKQLKRQIDNIPKLNEWTLNAITMGGSAAFVQGLSDLIVDRALFPEKGPFPRTEAAWQERLKQARIRIPMAVQDAVSTLTPIFEKHRVARKAVKEMRAPSFRAAKLDAEQQLADLFKPGFLTSTAWGWLCQYPRYLEAITRRMKKLGQTGAVRDRDSQDRIAPCLARYNQRRTELAARDLFDPHLEHYRWMIEEFRVSCFAQELGTAIPISEVRLEKQWEAVQK